MRVCEFDSYEQYLAVQRRGSHRRPGRRPAANEAEVQLIFKWWAAFWGCDPRDLPPITAILCHGARCGTEVRLFQAAFPNAEVVGTDLEPQGDGVVQHDFQQVREDWLGKFDIVYSNSLDHASLPEVTLRVWLDQLRPGGLLFVKWTTDHTLKSRPLPHPGGDCFGAELGETILLIESVGRVVDLLWLGMDRGRVCVEIVGGKR